VSNADDAGLDLTRAQFERACSLLPPDFTWGLPVTPRLVLDIALASSRSVEQVSNALYSHLMGGAFDIGEAYLDLKCVGSCPSEDDFLAALLALAAAKEPT
jgi:hypothetical protein